MPMQSKNKLSSQASIHIYLPPFTNQVFIWCFGFYSDINEMYTYTYNTNNFCSNICSRSFISKMKFANFCCSFFSLHFFVSLQLLACWGNTFWRKNDASRVFNDPFNLYDRYLFLHISKAKKRISKKTENDLNSFDLIAWIHGYFSFESINLWIKDLHGTMDCSNFQMILLIQRFYIINIFQHANCVSFNFLNEGELRKMLSHSSFY